MAGIEDLVAITITEPPPSEAAAGYTQVIRGTATFTDKFAAPPFVYASIQKKDWYKPEILEKTWHERGFPMPPDGKFEIEWIPDTKGHFEVTVVATPAPLSLPVVGVFPITGKSGMYKVEVGEAPPEEERVKDFVIVSYSKNGGPPVTPPSILELDVGDRCRLNVAFGHTGAATSGKFHAAIGNYGVWGFDEVLNAEKVFTTPATATDEWETFEDHIDILITSGISPGDYSLYVKIMGITGTDVFTEILENVIRVVGVAVEQKCAYIAPVLEGGHVEGSPAPNSIEKRLFGELWCYDKGTRVELTAIPDPGYRWVSWSFLSEVANRDINPTYMYMTEDRGATARVIVAEFELLAAAEPEFRNLVITAYDSPVAIGGTCRVHVQFEYQGPSLSKELYAAIGTYGFWGFDEIIHGAKAVSVPETQTWQGYEADVDIYISSQIDPAGSPYDIYAKINGVIPDVISPTLENVITVTGVAPPELESPEGETLYATDIIHDSATLNGRLIETSYWSNVDVYFEWGETTAYGRTTPKIRMYEGQEGSEFYTELLHYLTPGTTYHFRAVVEAVGLRSEEVGPGYGQDMAFTTRSEVVTGFTMRVRNAPPGAVYWLAGCVLGGVYPHMPLLKPLDYVWEWAKAVDDVTRDFFVVAAGAEQNGFFPTVQYHVFPFRLRNGKNYIYDWSLPYGERMGEV